MIFDQPFRHSLPVSDEAFQRPIYLTALGWERIEPGEVYPLSDVALVAFDWNDGRTLPDFCLAWLEQGEGILETKHHQQKIPERHAFFFQPGEWHRHRPEETTGWTIFWIGFNGNLPHQLAQGNQYDLEGNLPIIQDPELFAMQLKRLILTSHPSPFTNVPSLSWQASGILTHFVKDETYHQKKASDTDDELVNRAVEFVWNHSHSFVDVASVVSHIGCGRRALERRFCSALGRSLLDEIQYCRLSRAKRLLAETELPIKQVIYQAGLRSRQQLCLLTQKHLGMSPSQYRDKMQTS